MKHNDDNVVFLLFNRKGSKKKPTNRCLCGWNKPTAFAVEAFVVPSKAKDITVEFRCPNCDRVYRHSMSETATVSLTGRTIED